MNYNPDFRVVKVYTHKNKQIAFHVVSDICSGLILEPFSMVSAVRTGRKFTNATISSNGVIRVSKDVVREAADPATFPFPFLLD